MVTKRCNWYTLSSPLSVLDPGRNGSQLINLSWRNSSTPCGEDVFIQECRYNSSWYGTDPVNLERGGEKIKKQVDKIRSCICLQRTYSVSFKLSAQNGPLRIAPFFFCSKFGLSLSPFGELWSSPLAPNKWSFLKSYLFFTLNNHLYPIVGNSMNQIRLASLFMTVEFGSVLILLRIA